LKLRKIIVERVTVVKFGMNDGSCNEAGCFGIKKGTDATKLMNVRIARFRQCRDLIRESDVFKKTSR